MPPCKYCFWPTAVSTLVTEESFNADALVARNSETISGIDQSRKGSVVVVVTIVVGKPNEADEELSKVHKI